MDTSENLDNPEEQPRYCSKCGKSLVFLGTWCVSEPCAECGKEVFFINPGEDGGIKIEAGQKFHAPNLSFSLDPTQSGTFTRIGLEGFVKQIFSGQRIKTEEEFVEALKKLEAQIDNEISNFDCISHCDLETLEGVEEAMTILDSQGLHEYKFALARSGMIRACYEAIEQGDALKSSFAIYQSDIFKEYSKLEHHHLKEIIWLGYQCYLSLVRNEGMTEKSAIEQKLISAAQKKVRNSETSLLYALTHDGKEVASRLAIKDISEETLHALIEFELDRREKDKEESIKAEEIKISKSANKIKLWGFLFTLANALLLAAYKNWLG